MAQNFPNSPTNGDTTVINGITYTYVSASSKWRATQVGGSGAGSGGSGTTTYATIAELPLTGNAAGDQAFVLGNNILYIWNGTGWYRIATVENLSPTSITGVSASYTLSQNGTPTVITATSSDPEGFSLTWSYAVTSGSLGTTATVSQTDNVFTITPGTTDPDDAGTFELTFSVTDGTNSAVSTASTFTLQFAPPARYAIDTTATSNAANLQLTQVNLATPFAFPGQTKCMGVMFGDSGTKLYTLKYDSAAANTAYIIQYDLSTAYDITTNSNPVIHTITINSTNPRGLTMSKNGDYCYIAQGTSGVTALQLSTPWDFSTASTLYHHTLDATYNADIEISMDGTKVLFEIDGVFRIGTLSTPYDLRTSTTDSGTYDNSGFDNNPRGFQFDESGTKLTYMQNQTTLAVATFASSWTLTATPVSLVTYSLSGGGPGMTEFDIGPNIIIGDSYQDSGWLAYTIAGITTE